MKKDTQTDLYQTVTDRIVEAIEDSAGTFRLPWNEAGAAGLPENIASRKPYNGINILALWIAALSRGYTRSVWGTYRQWQEKGAQVRKGEKASLVIFYKTLGEETGERDNAEEAGERRFVARASYVFNADQVEGFDDPSAEPREPQFVNLEDADRFAYDSGATILEGGALACYAPGEDLIRMPDRWRFLGTATMTAAESYYATLMHELAHWTGAPSRLDRDLKHRFGSQAYAMEELVAELTAAFLCAELGITPETRPDHAQYIANWLEVLKSDKRAIFNAASKAQAAANYLKTRQQPST